MQRQPVLLGRSPGRAAVATVGAYSRNASEAAQNSCRPITADAPRDAESRREPRLPYGVALQQGRGDRGWGRRFAARDQGDLHPRLCLSKARETAGGTCTGTALERAQTSVCG